MDMPPSHDIVHKGYAKNIVYTVSLVGTPQR